MLSSTGDSPKSININGGEMKNRPILITGCQRSGTTLLHLILDSHPEIHGIDEIEYQESRLQYYLNDTHSPPQIAFKLPIYAPFIEWIKKLLPELRILWLVRNPRDVVASMMVTPLPLTQDTAIPWPSHSLGGVQEVSNCFPVLPANLAEELYPYWNRFITMLNTHPLS
jgi:hypothetical protein